MKKILLCIIIVFLVLSLSACRDIDSFSDDSNNELSNSTDKNNNEKPTDSNNSYTDPNVNCSPLNHHFYDYDVNDKTHLYRCFTCGDDTDGVAEEHYDFDGDNQCDACSYFLGTTINKLKIGTYYFPFESKYDPISLTFYENGRCKANYVEGSTKKYECNYYVEDGYVYLDISTAEKYHVFKITSFGLVLDFHKTTASLWHSFWDYMPVIFFNPGVSIKDKLSLTVMSDRNLDFMPEILTIYGDYEITTEYNTTLEAIAFSVDANRNGLPWTDKVLDTDITFAYPDSREILVYIQGALYTLSEAVDKDYIDIDILESLNKEFKNCKIAHSYNNGEIFQNEKIKYTCKTCGNYYFVELPEEFSFRLTFGFDGIYDSESGYLANGHNYDVGKKCETTLIFDRNELMDIYRVFYNGNFWNIKDTVRASDQVVMPSYNIKFSYTIDGETVDAVIYGASYLSYTEWDIYQEFAHAYMTVVDEYIKSSEEFKSMPPNQNMYD